MRPVYAAETAWPRPIRHNSPPASPTAGWSPPASCIPDRRPRRRTGHRMPWRHTTGSGIPPPIPPPLFLPRCRRTHPPQNLFLPCCRKVCPSHRPFPFQRAVCLFLRRRTGQGPVPCTKSLGESGAGANSSSSGLLLRMSRCGRCRRPRFRCRCCRRCRPSSLSGSWCVFRWYGCTGRTALSGVSRHR